MCGVLMNDIVKGKRGKWWLIVLRTVYGRWGGGEWRDVLIVTADKYYNA